MIRGITPIDTAFELMGLHQAQVMMRFIFIESHAGKLVFALGFILSMVSWLKKGSFRPVLVFLFMFFSLWFLLVLPRAKAADPVCAMERNGYQEITSLQILRQNGYAEVMVNPVLDMVSRFMDAAVSGIVAVMDRVGNGRGYLASPFLFTKVSVLTSSIIEAGITDAQLEQDLVNFYQDHYWPALRKLTVHEGAWPGAASVAGVYIEEGRAQWQGLRERLYGACDQEKIFTRLFERFYDGKEDRDAVVRALLVRELALKPLRYTALTYGARPPDAQGTAIAAGLNRPDIMIPRQIVQALPFVQGGALYILLSVFPIFLTMAFLLRQMKPLVLFMGIFFGVKIWTLVWVFIDKGSVVLWSVNKAWNGPEMWQSPSVNMLAMTGALVVPVLIMIGGYFIVGRKVEGARG